MKKIFLNILVRRVLLSLAAFLLIVVAFTVYVNVKVEKLAEGRIYTTIEEIPHNKVALLLGTNPLNRYGLYKLKTISLSSVRTPNFSPIIH